jgi:formylmethanofuran dehydrogenase subunit E
MGSYPRRERVEQMARERADTVPVLDCQSCGALTPGERFRYYGDQIVCDACNERNPQTVAVWCRERFSSPAIFW